MIVIAKCFKINTTNEVIAKCFKINTTNEVIAKCFKINTITDCINISKDNVNIILIYKKSLLILLLTHIFVFSLAIVSVTIFLPMSV